MAVAALAAITFAVPFTIVRDSFPPLAPAWAVFDETRLGQRLDATYADGITLLGLTRGATPPRPGGPLAVDLYWRADAPQKADVWATLRLVDDTGREIVQSHNPPQRDVYQPKLWQPGGVVIDPRTLLLPPSLPPGEYTLELRLSADTTGAEIPRFGGGWLRLDGVHLAPPAAGRS